MKNKKRDYRPCHPTPSILTDSRVLHRVHYAAKLVPFRFFCDWPLQRAFTVKEWGEARGATSAIIKKCSTANSIIDSCSVVYGLEFGKMVAYVANKYVTRRLHTPVYHLQQYSVSAGGRARAGDAVLAFY